MNPNSLPILAIDLGKDNSVFCLYHAHSGEVAFRSAPTTPDPSTINSHTATLTAVSVGGVTVGCH